MAHRAATKGLEGDTLFSERPGQLVGKHTLMDLVWPGLVVEENNLAAQVSALRKVLGGDLIATGAPSASRRRSSGCSSKRPKRSRAGEGDVSGGVIAAEVASRD